ncbi:hypothetical protein J3E69DRAFT_322256 [Trichoderma sp. SZMC 28015]
MDVSLRHSQTSKFPTASREPGTLFLILNCGRVRAGGDGLCAAMTRPKTHVSFRCVIYLIIAGIAQIRSALDGAQDGKLGVFSPT